MVEILPFIGKFYNGRLEKGLVHTAEQPSQSSSGTNKPKTDTFVVRTKKREDVLRRAVDIGGVQMVIAGKTDKPEETKAATAAPTEVGNVDVRMSGCQDVRMSGCQEARMSGCQAVRMSGCQDLDIRFF